MKTIIAICLKDIDSRKNLLKLLYSLGYVFGALKNVEDAIKTYDKYPEICAFIKHKSLFYGNGNLIESNQSLFICHSIGEFINEAIKPIPPVEIKVELNGKCSAVVTKEAIVVGCQEFTHESMDKLHEASLLARK